MKLHPTLLAVLFSASAIAQGPLTPPLGADAAVGPVNALSPGGAPQATMKTLHQVEPRTAIPGGSSTVTLSQPGSYYLTSDITVATGAGIVIAASGVTLDLNGFSIVSTNPSPDWGDLGVGLGYYIKNITIRNGTIGGGGAGGKFHTGIGATGFTASANVAVVDVSVSDTVQWGISLDSTSNSRVERCFVETEGVTGAIQARLVNDCSASGGGIYATIVRNSSVQGGGIAAKVVVTSHADRLIASPSPVIAADVVSDSFASGTGSADVIAAGVAHNVWSETSGGTGTGAAIAATVVGNSSGRRTAAGSTGEGIKATVVHASSGLAVEGAGIQGRIVSSSQGENSGTVAVGAGIAGQVVTASNGLSVSHRGISGRDAGAVVSGSTARSETAHGIALTRGVVSGSLGFTTAGAHGIENAGGVVATSRGRGTNIGITTGFELGAVALSYGLDGQTVGIYTDLATGSLGVGSGFGISGYVVHGSRGHATAPVFADPHVRGEYEFDSN